MSATPSSEAPPTFMQQVFTAAQVSANGVNAEDLRGISKDQFVETVRLVTGALDSLPKTTSMHAALYGLSFVRNAMIMAMQENAARMEAVTEKSS